MAVGYLSQEDVYRRLNYTVCFIKNEPVYVAVNRNFPCNTVHWTKMIDYVKNRRLDPDRHIDITNSEFSVKAPRLGYVNGEVSSVYVSRVPSRTSIQGLTSKHINLSGTTYDNRESIFLSEGFVSMLKNEYPKPKNVMARLLDRDAKSIAFSKDYAIGYLDPHNIALTFKEGRILGIYDAKEDGFKSMPVCMGKSLLSLDLLKHGVKLL